MIWFIVDKKLINLIWSNIVLLSSFIRTFTNFVRFIVRFIYYVYYVSKADYNILIYYWRKTDEFKITVHDIVITLPYLHLLCLCLVCLFYLCLLCLCSPQFYCPLHSLRLLYLTLGRPLHFDLLCICFICSHLYACSFFYFCLYCIFLLAYLYIFTL